MLTQERADLISRFLADDQKRAEHLLGMEPIDALKEINALGYDFTVEELVEYGDALNRTIAAAGELKADELERVAGGIAVSVGIMIACGVAGFVAGFAVSKKW